MPRILIRRGFIQDGRDLLPGETHDVADTVARREIAAGSAILAPSDDPPAAASVAPPAAPSAMPTPAKGKGRR